MVNIQQTSKTNFTTLNPFDMLQHKFTPTTEKNDKEPVEKPQGMDIQQLTDGSDHPNKPNLL